MSLANAPETRVTEDTRIPMSTPRRKLEAPEIPGRHCFWFLESNVPVAKQAGYEFVYNDQVNLFQDGVATPSDVSGSSDLGTLVTRIAQPYSGSGPNGVTEKLVLMSIKLEWWQKDQKVLEERNAAILSGIFKEEKIAGSEQVSPEDRGVRYVKTALFSRPTRKGK